MTELFPGFRELGHVREVNEVTRESGLQLIVSCPLSLYEGLTKSDDERVRLGAIQAALDRGWGKAVQHTEAEISVYDSLSLDEQQALLAILESLDAPDEEGDSSGAAPTHH